MPSFHPIAGFNANGAPHYRATEDSHATICMRGTVGTGLLLIDSGGQYEYGTTDITRVVPVGETTAGQRRDYTLVLKGMIAYRWRNFRAARVARCWTPSHARRSGRPVSTSAMARVMAFIF